MATQTVVYLLQFTARLLSLTLMVALAFSGLAKLVSSTKVCITIYCPLVQLQPP